MVNGRDNSGFLFGVDGVLYTYIIPSKLSLQLRNENAHMGYVA